MLSTIGLGITTKDRWDDLYLTLGKIEEYGLKINETLVIDDGSREPLPEKFKTRFPQVRFTRSEQSLGLIVQRNRLARLLSSPLYLSLDDDSFPISGDLTAAAAWLEARTEALALGFFVTRDSDYLKDDRLFPSQPYPCKYFIGCAALIKREPFLALGGYVELLHYYCEDIGLGLAACSRNLVIYHYPQVIVHHNYSAVSRNPLRIFRYMIRNELLLTVLYYPFPLVMLRPISFIFKAFVTRWAPLSAVWKGLGSALKTLPSALPLRKPLTLAHFLLWKKLQRPYEVAKGIPL